MADQLTQRDGQRILVTGGLGFIGSFVAESLADRGAHITVVDSCVSSVLEPEDLKIPAGQVDFELVGVEEYILRTPSLDAYDMVVHCASYVGPASILKYSGQLGPAIVAATSALIEKCIASDIPLVNFSSAEIYGRSGILREDGDIRVPPYYNPRIEYALGKLTAESMVINSKHRGLRSATIRPFNVAGPRQSRYGGFVMPTFVQQALVGRPMTVFHTLHEPPPVSARRMRMARSVSRLSSADSRRSSRSRCASSSAARSSADSLSRRSSVSVGKSSRAARAASTSRSCSACSSRMRAKATSPSCAPGQSGHDRSAC